MKNAIKILCIGLIFFNLSLFAQDLQEVYAEAKSALLEGNVEKALLQISVAHAMIDEDPNIDPNGNFKNKLLPKLEDTANNMNAAIKALEELNFSSQQQMSVDSLDSSLEGVSTFTQLAKSVSNSAIEKRDSILALYDLDAQYAEALRKSPAYQQMDQFVTQGIMDTLSGKFIVFAGDFTENLNRLNENFKKVSDELNKMKKSASANRSEIKKLEKELEEVSQERLNYMNAISEMLKGEGVSENAELNAQFLENNVEGIFTEMVQTEIERIKGLTEVDSATYKDLMKNYNLIKEYNSIFIKHNISTDQSELLAQYERAIRNLNVVAEEKYNPYLIGGIIGGIVIIFLLVYLLSRSKGTAKPEKPVSSPPPPPAEPKK
jgi:archaellum component FlaC